MKKNGLIALISVLAAVAGAVAAIFAITKKLGNKKAQEQLDQENNPDHIEIDIDDDDYPMTEEEYQTESAEIPQQEIDPIDDSEDVEEEEASEEEENQ